MTDRLEQARQEKNRYKRRALEAEADRDRARSIAVALEQEVSELEARNDETEWRLSCLLDDATGGRLSKPGYPVPIMTSAIDEHYERTYGAEAAAAHSVIEQVGLLQEWLAAAGSVVAPRLQHILDGGTLDEVRQAIYDGANDG